MGVCRNTFDISVLLASVRITDAGCWEWVRTKPGTTTGYPSYSLNGKSSLVHRLVYQTFKAKLSAGECVLHRCDNRLCVNPDHLLCGTKGDNNRDRAAKQRSATGERCHLAKLDEPTVLRIEAEAGTYRGLARKYGLNKGTIKQIKTHTTWRHLWK